MDEEESPEEYTEDVLQTIGGLRNVAHSITIRPSLRSKVRARLEVLLPSEGPSLQVLAPKDPWRDRLWSWISLPWHPTWAGEMVTAADISEQEHIFAHPEGEITVRCRWRAAYRNQPATLRVIWQANITSPGDVWVRFTKSDEPTVVLAELRLGSTLEGEEEFTSNELGFDPGQELWTLTIILKAPPSA